MTRDFFLYFAYAELIGPYLPLQSGVNNFGAPVRKEGVLMQDGERLFINYGRKVLTQGSVELHVHNMRALRVRKIGLRS